MRALLIDPAQRSIVETEYDGSPASLHMLLGIDRGSRLAQLVPGAAVARSDGLYVDEEGLLRPETRVLGRFRIRGCRELLAGRGVVLGSGGGGETTDARTTLDALRRAVAWEQRT